MQNGVLVPTIVGLAIGAGFVATFALMGAGVPEGEPEAKLPIVMIPKRRMNQPG